MKTERSVEGRQVTDAFGFVSLLETDRAHLPAERYRTWEHLKAETF